MFGPEGRPSRPTSPHRRAHEIWYNSFVSRKYRQAGYQDEERGRGERPAPRAPRPPADRLRPEAPRGRGLGAPGREVFRCAVCGALQAAAGAAEATAKCEGCGADLHTCTHCAHFDTSARFECRQPIPERVAGKGKANDCARFAPRVSVEHTAERSEPEDPRAAFDALFDKL
jgi:hypothetical protein